MDTRTFRLLVNKGLRPNVLRRVMLERLTEPLHLNLASALVAMLGSFRLKVAFDLVYKQPYAWGILRAAEPARDTGQRASRWSKPG